MSPSPSDLTYFIEVANMSNLSRASESLGISQPSLTLAMQRLEDNVGAPLLIRHKRGVTLTKAGEQLLAHARELMQRWESIKSHALASMHEVQGAITLGSHPAVALYTLPHILPKLMAEHPKLEIQLKHDLSRRITENVISLKVDIGIIVNPVRHPDLVITHLDHDIITLWSADPKRSLKQLQDGSAIILCDPELAQAQNILAQLKKSGLEYGRLVSSNNMDVLSLLTQQNGGISILPARVAENYGLKRIPKAPFYEDEICVLYRGENRNVRAIQVVVETIRKLFVKACRG
jgi:DNA-binding transcriptional LysR family regulator